MVERADEFYYGKSKAERENEKKKGNAIVPAFKWAQSTDKIFIEVKFATRLDTPACVEIFD